MKKRYVPIITVTIAILLVGSIAYAADKRKQGKLMIPEPKGMSEEALKAELLESNDDQHKQKQDIKTDSSRKAVDNVPEQGNPPSSTQITPLPITK